MHEAGSSSKRILKTLHIYHRLLSFYKCVFPYSKLLRRFYGFHIRVLVVKFIEYKNK